MTDMMMMIYYCIAVI